MSQYEIKDPDGQIHRIEAVTHVLDSNGLTLYASAGVVVAIFPRFSWMRQQQAVVEDSATEAGESTDSGEVVTPAETGE
ncbi:hypothetical protein LU687_011370 [Pseudomonas asiatica]|uniref:hypothetical protein n=1 Tax=Pseudomonas asiatica TaxID=2219225 RepID=UPI001E565A12|nr:hypothetical protein [Pseudomonas asiatica]WJR24947.1 hypothetical protein LU687_011370 [Pseudomonas asiatica]